MEDENETRKYINEKINPILEKLVVDMLIHRPVNPVIFNPKKKYIINLSQVSIYSRMVRKKSGYYLI